MEIKKDKLWKGFLEDFMEEAIRFFYPDLANEIDFSKKFVFLDKELRELFPETDAPGRFADFLVKVYLKVGGERLLFMHIEVQGYYDKNFDKRMFNYFYRIYDRFYGEIIIALAIFVYDNSDHPQGTFQYISPETELTYRFKTFNLVEYPPAVLAQMDSPIALALEVAWLAIEKPDADQLLSLKKQLVRRLFERDYPKKKIQQILNFITYYVNFDKKEGDKIVQYNNFVNQIIKKDETMGIQEVILEAAKEEKEKWKQKISQLDQEIEQLGKQKEQLGKQQERWEEEKRQLGHQKERWEEEKKQWQQENQKRINFERQKAIRALLRSDASIAFIVEALDIEEAYVLQVKNQLEAE